MLRGLEGIRVVEVGEMVSAPWAAKLMADLGADVVKVEPPGGDRARRRGPFRDGGTVGGLFTYLNLNKRSVAADLTTADGRAELTRLVGGADLVIHNVVPSAQAERGLDAGTLRADRPDLVVCAVTPFGGSGPYAHLRAEELNLVHGGGWGWLSPGCSDRDDLPPLKPFGHQADFAAGFAAATVALAAVDRAQRTGHGEFIDLSVMAHVAGMLEAGFVSWSYLGENPSRLGARILNPWRILPTRDGQIFVVCPEGDQWERLKDAMGHPEWSEMDLFTTMEGRFEAEDLLHMWLGEWTAQHDTMPLFEHIQSHRVAAAPVFTMAQMADDPHLADRGFLVEVDQPGLGPVRLPGAPSRLTNPWWQVRRPAPGLDQHAGAGFGPRSASVPPAGTDPARPLEGVRIADFTWVWAGPYCALHLAHLGADVIKVESAAAPDLGRRLPLHADDLDPTPDTNGYFNQWNQGKRGVTIDLSGEEGRALARRLALACDAVVSNYATGVMDRLGLSYDQLRAERPDVIVATISGFGNHGPYREYMGYGPTTAPLSGLASLSGYEGGDASEIGISLGDPAGGIATAFALVAALAARRRTGEGQYIDTTLWEATTVAAIEGWAAWELNGAQPDRMGNRDPLMAPHNLYRCAGDDHWVSIACVTDDDWAAVAALTGIDDPRFADGPGRKAHEDDLDGCLAAWCAPLDRWEVTERLQSVGVAAFPCLSPADLEDDPHLAARGLIERLDHPAVGTRAHVGIPWLLAEADNGVRSPAPLRGQHTDDVLAEVLHLDADEIARLHDRGVLS